MSRRLDLVGSMETAIEGLIHEAEDTYGSFYKRVIRRAFYEALSEAELRSAIAGVLREHHLICDACFEWEVDNWKPNPTSTDACRCPTPAQLAWLAKAVA